MKTDETDEAEKKDADQQEEPRPENQKHSEEDPGSDLEQKSETEPMEGKEVMSEDMKPNDNISGVESGSQNPHGSNVLGAGSTAAQEDLSVTDELTDSMDLPSGSKTEMNLMSLASGETLTDSISKMEVPENQSSTDHMATNDDHEICEEEAWRRKLGGGRSG